MNFDYDIYSLESYDYDLPKERIAQSPSEQRDHSRLLVVDRKNGEMKDEQYFHNIISYLQPGDVLVRNNTKVIPARLIGTKEKTLAHVELLLLQEKEKDTYLCLVGNAKVVKKDTVIIFGNKLKAVCTEVLDEGLRKFHFIYDGIFMEILDELGKIPLPPYIQEQLVDNSRYQTVYAKVAGSAAAPTAGFHFTDELLDELKNKGITIVDITLHIGLGTFRPVKVDDIRQHNMHSEHYFMDKETASILNQAKKEKRRIIAIGTTVTRTLESVYHKYHEFRECSDDTSIFIYPGFEFLAIDALITNFHLPKSTLVMLVSAFSSRDIILNAYKHAIENNYRFFSFGDAMFLK